MAVCDMCGKQGTMVIALIEGSNLTVCESCARYGKIMKRLEPIQAPKKHNLPAMPVIVETIVADYAQKIKQAREKLNLTQEELAKKINERVSRLHNIESGHHEPDMPLAKKLEKFFHITLIEEEKVGDEKQYISSDKKEVTIGDIIQIKKRS